MLSRLMTLSGGGSIDESSDYWISEIGSVYQTRTLSSVIDSSGNIYSVSYTTEFGSDNGKIITKYSKTGSIQWQRILYGASGVGNNAFITRDKTNDNIYIAFNTISGSTKCIEIAKLDSIGTIISRNTISLTDDANNLIGTEITNIKCDSSGNVYVACSFTYNVNATPCGLIKIDSSGVVQWRRAIGGTVAVPPQSHLAIDSSGNIYIVLFIDFYNFIVKYSPSGTLLWQVKIGGDTEVLRGIAVDSANNIYVVGNVTSNLVVSSIVLKYTSSGTLQWQRKLSTSVAFSVAIDSSNGIYITGYSSESRPYKIMIAKYNDAGSLLYQRQLFATSNTLDMSAYDITIGSNNEMCLSGYKWVNDIYKRLTIRLPIDGSLAGSYGEYTYEPSNLIGTTPAFTSTASSLTQLTTIGISYPSTQITQAYVGLQSIRTPIKSYYWIAEYGTVENVTIRGIAIDQTNNVNIGGNLNTIGSFTAKFDYRGNILWQKTMDSETINGIVTNQSGESYIVGGSASGPAVIKCNPNGLITFSKALSGDGVFGGLALDPTGNIYTSGILLSDTTQLDLIAAKYNSSGVLQWQRKITGSGRDYALYTAVDTAGNMYIAGQTDTQTAGVDDVLLVKYNTSGTIQWQRRLGGVNSDVISGLIVDSSANPYVLCHDTTTPTVTLVKYNTSGTVQWQKIIGVNQLDTSVALAIDSSNNIYVGAAGYNIPTSGANSLVISKYDTNGSLIWRRAITGISPYDKAITTDNSGNYYIAGKLDINIGSIIIKLPASGDLTGVYGNITYASVNIDDSTNALTAAATTLTAATGTLTAATISPTQTNSNLSINLRPIG